MLSLFLPMRSDPGAHFRGAALASSSLLARLNAGLRGSIPALSSLTGNVEAYGMFAAALDFKNGYYRNAPTTYPAISSLAGYSYTRAGAKSEQDAAGTGLVSFSANVPGIVPGVGFWAREALTNILLNAGTSSDLTTQSVTVSAVAYTLSFIGTGTVTLSGTSTAGPLVGTGASNRVSLTFTPSAGTLTLTVTGSAKYAGLMLGTQAGPIIATAGSAATAAVDQLNVTNPVTTDQDFVFYTVVNFPIANTSGANQRLASMYVSSNEAIFFNRATNSRLVATATVGGVAVDSSGTSLPIVTTGRCVVLVRRRAGKYTFATKNAAGTVAALAEGASTTFPALTSSVIQVGHRATGSDPARSVIEFVGTRLGTFSDGDLTAILTAA